MIPGPWFRSACAALGLLCPWSTAGAASTLIVHNQSGGTLVLNLPWNTDPWDPLPGPGWSRSRLLEHGRGALVRFTLPDQALVADLVIHRLGGEGRISFEGLEIQALEPAFVAISASPLPVPGTTGESGLPSD